MYKDGNDYFEEMLKNLDLDDDHESDLDHCGETADLLAPFHAPFAIFSPLQPLEPAFVLFHTLRVLSLPARELAFFSLLEHVLFPPVLPVLAQLPSFDVEPRLVQLHVSLLALPLGGFAFLSVCLQSLLCTLLLF